MLFNIKNYYPITMHCHDTNTNTKPKKTRIPILYQIPIQLFLTFIYS